MGTSELANHLAKGTEAIQVLINRPALTSILLVCASVCLICSVLSTWASAQTAELSWRALPSIPDELGLAGPIVGVQDEILVAGGGANFARPVWTTRNSGTVLCMFWTYASLCPQWLQVSEYPSDALSQRVREHTLWNRHYRRQRFAARVCSCWLLSVKRMTNGGLETELRSLPDLPQPLVYGQAVWMKDRLVVLTGQTGSTLTSAIAGGWYLQMNKAIDTSLGQWQPIAACPGGVRAFANRLQRWMMIQLLVTCGRRQNRDQIEFLKGCVAIPYRPAAMATMADLRWRSLRVALVFEWSSRCGQRR